MEAVVGLEMEAAVGLEMEAAADWETGVEGVVAGWGKAEGALEAAAAAERMLKRCHTGQSGRKAERRRQRSCRNTTS